MKKISIIIVLLISSISVCNAQKIELERTIIGYKYTQNGEKLSIKKMESILDDNSKVLFKKANSNLILSSILNFSGGFLIGIPIGQSIGGKNANWALAGIGAGIAIVGLTIYSSANKKIKKSIELHNSKQISTAFYEFKLTTSSSGIGLSLNF